DLAGPAHEVLQHRQLSRGQSDFDAALVAGTGGRIDLQVAGYQDRWPLTAAASQEGPDPGQQHRVRERLREEVIGTGVERFGLIELAVLGGEHEDGRPDPL